MGRRYHELTFTGRPYLECAQGDDINNGRIWRGDIVNGRIRRRDTVEKRIGEGDNVNGRV